MSACSAIAESGRRSPSNRPTSSAVRCCASAALPPLPAASSRFPASSRRPRSSPHRARVGRGGLQRRQGAVEPVDVRAEQRGDLVDPAGRVRAAGRGPGDPRVRPARCSQAWVPVRGPSPDGARRGGHRATPSTVEPSPRKSSRSADCSSAGAGRAGPRPLRQHVRVHRGGRLGDAVPAVAGQHAVAAGDAERQRLRRCGEQGPQRGRQHVGPARGHEQAGDLVHDGVLDAADRARDHGAPAGHGLERHDPERLVPGHAHHRVRGAQQRRHVRPGDRAEQPDPVRDARRGRRVPQPPRVGVAVQRRRRTRRTRPARPRRAARRPAAGAAPRSPRRRPCAARGGPARRSGAGPSAGARGRRARTRPCRPRTARRSRAGAGRPGGRARTPRRCRWR